MGSRVSCRCRYWLACSSLDAVSLGVPSADLAREDPAEPGAPERLERLRGAIVQAPSAIHHEAVEAVPHLDVHRAKERLDAAVRNLRIVQRQDRRAPRRNKIR